MSGSAIACRRAARFGVYPATLIDFDQVVVDRTAIDVGVEDFA
jgi:hypothetical protein